MPGFARGARARRVRGLARRFTILVAMIIAVGASVPVPASAQTPSHTFVTPGCAGAPTWTFAFPLYFRDAHGRQLDRERKLVEVLPRIEQFASWVGEFSECGVRASVDVYDMADAAWPTDRRRPANVSTLLENHDTAFFMYPARGDEPFVGQTDYSTAIFPAPLGDPGGQPYPITMVHEWLHIVHSFCTTRAGVDWPRGDVHADFASYGYEQNYQGALDFYRDLMRGSVPENGRLLGMRREQWSRCGTPTAARDEVPAPSSAVPPSGRDGATGSGGSSGDNDVRPTPGPPSTTTGSTTPTRESPVLRVAGVRRRQGVAYVRGTIAGTASGTVSVRATYRLGGRTRTARRRPRAKAGRWSARLRVPVRARVLRVKVTYAGDARYEGESISR